jgi:hypothetical protein
MPPGPAALPTTMSGGGPSGRMGAGEGFRRAPAGLRAEAPLARARGSRCSVCARSAVRGPGSTSWPSSAPSPRSPRDFSAGRVARPETMRATMDVPQAAVLVVGSVAVSTTAAPGRAAVAILPGSAPCAEDCVPLVDAPAAAGATGRARPACSPLGRSSAAGSGAGSSLAAGSDSGCGSGSGSGSGWAGGSGCGCGWAGGSGCGCGWAGGSGCGCGWAEGSGCGCVSAEGSGGGCESVAGVAAAT